MVRTIGNSRGMLLGLVLLATVSVTACTPLLGGSTAAQPNSQTASAPTATAANTPAATATAAATSPADTPSATTGSSGVQNLTVTSALLSDLTSVWASQKGIPLSEVQGGGPMPDSVYYAYDPATDTYWAAANFHPVNGLSLSALDAFDNAGGIAMFQKVGAGSWQLQTAASSLTCVAPHYFPATVLTAWSMSTTPQCQD